MHNPSLIPSEPPAAFTEAREALRDTPRRLMRSANKTRTGMVKNVSYTLQCHCGFSEKLRVTDHRLHEAVLGEALWALEHHESVCALSATSESSTAATN